MVLKLKAPWRDGTTHIVMSPLAFRQRPAALVPRSRLHLIRLHGVLPPNASADSTDAAAWPRAGYRQIGHELQRRPSNVHRVAVEPDIPIIMKRNTLNPLGLS